MNEDKRLWHEKRSKDEIDLEIETNPEEAAFNLYEDILCMKAADGWISVSDRLPFYGKEIEGQFKAEVFMVSDGEEVYSGNFQAGNSVTAWEYFEDDDVTHWQPRPPLPTK